MTLQQILFWSLRGSGLILLGMLLGRQKQKIPAKGMLLLWQAAILRLCLPGQIALPVPWMEASVSRNPAGGGQMQIWLWVCGVFVAGMALAFRWQRGRRLLAKARPLSDASCRQWLGGGTKRKVKVMLCPGIRTPLAAGLLRPYILLPQDMDRQDKERLRFVITHEMVHIRRWDLWWKGLALLCRCLHWFNPLVWLLPALLEETWSDPVTKRVWSIWAPGKRKDMPWLYGPWPKSKAPFGKGPAALEQVDWKKGSV